VFGGPKEERFMPFSGLRWAISGATKVLRSGTERDNSVGGERHIRGSGEVEKSLEGITVYREKGEI